MNNKYSFLLIEDSEIDQLVTRQLLMKVLGITELNIANNGAEGLQWLHSKRSNLNKSLIILLDIQMPVMSGFDFLNEYEMLPEDLKRETQIFVLSSTLDCDDIEKARNNKYVRSFWNKPLPLEELVTIISI